MSFLPGMFPCGMLTAAARAPAALSYVGITKAAATQNHTLNAVNIGAEDPTRRLIFAVHSSNSVGFRTVTAFTVDGVSILPAHVTINSSGFNGGHIAIFSVLKPTGTAANLQINFNGTNASLSVEMFRAINETALTPHATMTDDSIASNTVNGIINIPANGWIMATCNHFGSPAASAVNWSGVTKASDDVIGTSIIRCSNGIANGLALQTGRAISAVNVGSTSSQLGALAAMSWG